MHRLALPLTLVGLSALAGCRPKAGDDLDTVVILPPEEFLEQAEAFRQTRPPFERGRGHLEVPEGLTDLSAETCGQCHTEIYQEWSVSTHRRAWLDDVQYQAELEKNSHIRDMPLGDGIHTADMSWNCIQCHTPLMQQQPQVVIGLREGQPWFPIYAENPFYDEALQEEAITCATCHVADGYVLGPYGDTQAPHAVRRDESLLNETVCTQCHQAEAQYEEIGLACMFHTGNEWSTWSEDNSGETCQSCHMPEIERPLMEGFPARRTRYHYFGGSLIPKAPEYAEELEALRPLFGSGVDVTLEPDPAGGVRINIANTHAGHRMPTGDPERHLEIHAQVLNAAGETLSEDELLIGAVYEWDPMPNLISDNRIPPGESVYLSLGELPAGAAEVVIVGDKYRMHQSAFDYHELEGRYVRGRRFHTSRWRVTATGVVLTELVDDWHPEGATIGPDGQVIEPDTAVPDELAPAATEQVEGAADGSGAVPNE